MSCPDCFSGHAHAGETKGRVLKVHGRDAYVTEPGDGADAKGIIVFLPDAFGWEFDNGRILADHYAARGFRVYVPDLMDGTAVSPSVLPLFMSLFAPKRGLLDYVWMPYYLARVVWHVAPFLYLNRPSAAWPKVKGWMTALRESQDPAERDLPVFTAGFCWGGKFVVLLSHQDAVTSTGRPLVDAGFTAHPSLLKIPEDIEKVTRPLSIAAGDKDHALDAKALQKVRTTLEGKKGEVETEVVVYEGAGHGFAVRADPGNEKVMEHAVESEKQAVAWFEKHAKK